VSSPSPQVDVAAPWRVVGERDGELRLQLGGSPRGAVVRWGAAARGAPGVAVIERGLELPGHNAPLVAFGFPDAPLSELRIMTQAQDLVVRATGPTLSSVSADPLADDRPMVTMIRLRPRPDDWRVVVDGLTTWTFPSPTGPVREVAAGWRLDTPEGVFELELEDTTWQRSQLTEQAWTLSDRGALEHREPYPRSALTWTPQTQRSR